MKRATLKDVAKEALTSVSTVSRALRDDPQISEETRVRVHAAADRLGYQADLAGSLLRMNRPRIIGLLCRIDQELHLVYREHILAEAELRGFRVLTEAVSETRDARSSLAALRQLRTQSVIIVDPGTVAGLEDELPPDHTVIIGQRPSIDSADLVTSDNSRGLQQLVAHLVQQGHAEVVYLDGGDSVSATARREALQRAASEQGVAVEVVAAGSTPDEGLHALSAALDDRKARQLSAPSAVVSYNDQCAQGAIVALWRSGLRPGVDVAVAGFDNSHLASTDTFALTSIDRSPREVAAMAVELAVQRATADEPLPAQRRHVDTSLVVRASSSTAAH